MKIGTVIRIGLFDGVVESIEDGEPLRVRMIDTDAIVTRPKRYTIVTETQDV